MKKIVISILVLYLMTNLYSQHIPCGLEIQVNSYVNNSQWSPYIIVLGNDNVFICWESVEQDGSLRGVFGQLFDSSGEKLGDEFQINSNTQGNQLAVSAAYLNNNTFVVVWQDDIKTSEFGAFPNILAQLFTNSGERIGNEFWCNTDTYINPGSIHQQKSPEVAVFANGNFVVIWERHTPFSSSIWGQLFEPSGKKIGDEFSVAESSTEILSNPQITKLDENTFVIVWAFGSRDRLSSGIIGQIFDSSGYPISQKISINSTINEWTAVSEPTVDAFEGEKKIIVCWNAYNRRDYRSRVFGQIFNYNGEKIGEEFSINSDKHSSQGKPYVATLDQEGFVVSYYTGTILGQFYSYDGIQKGVEFQMSKYCCNNFAPISPMIAKLSAGDFRACWEGPDGVSSGIFSKHFILPVNHQLHDFSLLNPPHDSTLDTRSPTFEWQQPGNIVECYSWEISFDLSIDINPNFLNPLVFENIVDNSFTIDSLDADETYFWKTNAKNINGDVIWGNEQYWKFHINKGAFPVSIRESEKTPKSFMISQNYPNPFNPSTTIQFKLNQRSIVKLKVFDIAGKEITTLVNQTLAAGSHKIKFEPQGLPSGVYFYRIEAGKFIQTKKLIFLK